MSVFAPTLTSGSFPSRSPMDTPSGKNMRRSGGIAAKVGGIDHQLCVREWRKRYPSKTASELAARYGCPVRTAENWLSLNATPSFDWLGVIVSVEDPEFMVSVMPDPPRYLQVAAVEAQNERIEANFQAALEARRAARGEL